jgi:hypothetical protein
MHTGNENPKYDQEQAPWFLLAECSLSAGLSAEGIKAELSASSLFQAMRGLGVPPETLHRIEGTITGIIKVETSPLNNGGPKKALSIRLYHYRKALHPPPPSALCTGGWGYYLIEKNFVPSPASSSEVPHPREIALYLYQEGG